MKTFVIGDIHGRADALNEVLNKCKFNIKKDKLIVLGDIVDGGFNTYDVVEELLKIKNLIYIIGNHDEWFMNHIRTGWAEEIWLQQGGCNTLNSYGAKTKEVDYVSDESFVDTSNMNIPITHQNFFNKGKYWHIQDNMIFVHGGFNPKIPKMESQSKFDLVWDRYLIQYAQSGNFIKPYDWVFVGHTTTQTYGMNEPIRFRNLYMLDCGAGWEGKLAIMDIDTKKFWLSKLQKPAIRGRVNMTKDEKIKTMT